jgi:biotin transport system substrate-specific component
LNWAITANLRPLKKKSLLGQLILVALGVQLLFFTSFICLQLPTATQRNLEHYGISVAQEFVPYLPETWQDRAVGAMPELNEVQPETRFSPYVPMVPVAVFVGYILGVPLGSMAALIYFVLGLAGPYLGILPFAAGGGLDYYRQPGFGYLFGLIFGSWFAGRITMRATTSMRQILAVTGGVILVHLLGLFYLTGSSLSVLLIEGETAYLRWQPWLFEQIRNLSWYALPYDVLFSLLLIGVGAPFRWLVATLTAPDIAMRRSKPNWDRKLEQASVS